MAKSLSLRFLHPKPMAFSASTTMKFTPSPLLFSSKPKSLNKLVFSLPLRWFSSTSSPYPLQYEMIINRPTQPPPAQTRRRPTRLSKSDSYSSPEPESPQTPDSELGLDSWVEQKLSVDRDDVEMDKSKRKYYNKRRKRMYGSDSDEDGGKNEEGFVELKPEVVNFRSLHKREEELYFYDTFAYPWEKDKHYKMVYQLEKKYFPDQCFDKAFIDPKDSNMNSNGIAKSSRSGKRAEKRDNGVVDQQDDRGLVFFEEKGEIETNSAKDSNKDITERKVEEFFKCLKKVPSKDNEVDNREPYLVTRSTELPPTWDGPHGTVVLVNKPKGWTSFTVCGKLRRLVKVKKVGHAGTLDPMATGLLIVCVGKATKLVERYQGMIKGYSGVLRLGEATSTWDADSPVIQREPWEHIKDVDIRKAAASFCGEIWQVPPMFSAIKLLFTHFWKINELMLFSKAVQPVF
ncbi:uncharacterized protein LOC110649594 isoform X2 [Hevea brasiliensis]|uniref:uncharacterized protein LOC110649594 isoform X2 n=1 Tax=Hevea brasiliensis TaxID=3981 RepID=UPI0026012C0D|nr:uncharacterized protein LOC110649594 isoform X2 [Hevea brasiliensis]